MSSSATAQKRLEELNGKLAGLGNKSVRISSDHGATWPPILESTATQPAGVIYSPARQAFFAWNWDCGNKVLTNGVWRHDYRVEPKSQR